MIPSMLLLGLPLAVRLGSVEHKPLLCQQSIVSEPHAEIGHIGFVNVIPIRSRLPVCLMDPVHLHLRFTKNLL